MGNIALEVFSVLNLSEINDRCVMCSALDNFQKFLLFKHPFLIFFPLFSKVYNYDTTIMQFFCISDVEWAKIRKKLQRRRNEKIWTHMLFQATRKSFLCRN